MASLAAFPKMLERNRRRHGLRVCRAAWLLGISVREYRELESGSFPTSEVYERICDVFGWPTSYSGATITLGGGHPQQHRARICSAATRQ
jgi:hypothetical protein